MSRWMLGTRLMLAAAPALADSCTNQAPPALRATLERSFPGFTFPHEYDNDPADVAMAQDREGVSCMGVINDDFDGDHRSDLVVALTALDGQGAMPVSIQDALGSASITTLDQQRRGRRALSLRAGNPGMYARNRSAINGLRRR